MPKAYGDISYGLSVGDGQAVRLNAGGTAFEAYTPGSGGGSVEELKTASFTAEKDGKYAVDATSGIITVTDPSDPSDNDQFVVTFVGGSINAVTVGGEAWYPYLADGNYLVRKFYGSSWTTKRFSPPANPYVFSEHFIWENEYDFLSSGQVGLQWRNSAYNAQAIRNATVSWFGLPPIGSDARVSIRKGTSDNAGTQSDVPFSGIGWGMGADYVTVFPLAPSITRQKSGTAISIKLLPANVEKFVNGAYYKLSGFGGTGYNSVFQCSGTGTDYVNFNSPVDVGTEAEMADTAGTIQFESVYCSFSSKSVAPSEQIVPYVTYPSAFTYGGRGLSVDLEMAIS